MCAHPGGKPVEAAAGPCTRMLHPWQLGPWAPAPAGQIIAHPLPSCIPAPPLSGGRGLKWSGVPHPLKLTPPSALSTGPRKAGAAAWVVLWGGGA